MRIVLFYQSILSDWNHGNAHFLRGVVSELMSRGMDVRVYEPMESWSLRNLLTEEGFRPVEELLERFPWLKHRSNRYDTERLDLEEALDGADLCIVHEWNERTIVKMLGDFRKGSSGQRLKLLFHDTHHRSFTETESMAGYDLSGYDGVLVFGEALKERYRALGWEGPVWTWHEAADTRVFKPVSGDCTGDAVWIGNWGDGERSAELNEYFVDPVRELRLNASAYGVRYPEDALKALCAASINYGGWLANFKVPEVYSSFKAAIHVPRGPYARALPGIPTIRVFEALACGIPLVSAPWEDSEGLFTPGRDFIAVKNGAGMKRALKDLLSDFQMRRELSQNGLSAIHRCHTCGHRVDELMEIYGELSGAVNARAFA